MRAYHSAFLGLLVAVGCNAKANDRVLDRDRDLKVAETNCDRPVPAPIPVPDPRRRGPGGPVGGDGAGPWNRTERGGHAGLRPTSNRRPWRQRT